MATTTAMTKNKLIAQTCMKIDFSINIYEFLSLFSFEMSIFETHVLDAEQNEGNEYYFLHVHLEDQPEPVVNIFHVADGLAKKCNSLHFRHICKFHVPMIFSRLEKPIFIERFLFSYVSTA